MPSISYVHGASEVPLIGATITEAFDRTVQRFPDREALVVCHQDIRLTWAQLKVECERFARGLIALGLKKGDRIGIWSPNWAEWVIAQFATPRIGAILVNINPANRAGELEYALRQSGCTALIIAPPLKASNYAEILAQVEAPALRTVIYFGNQMVAGGHNWGEVLRLGETVTEEELRAREREQHFDDPINIQYTSGTTGHPKGATLSHHSILNNAFFIGRRMRLTERDRLCIPVPFYHCFGMVLGNLACLTHGSTMVIPAATFDPGETLKAVQDERCTALHGVPTMFIAELSHPDFASYDLSTLRTGIMAGSPCPVEVMRAVTTRMHMTEVTICYGMTETSPVSFQTVAEDPIEKRVATVGRAHPHVECKIIDPETGAVVPRGVTGELLSRGYLLMLGYWNDPAATRNCIDDARWMHTGDLAVMDEEGYVSIVGRSKDMIIRGGENIYPREVEEFLYGHAHIRDVSVIGVPDEIYGEAVMAWVILKPGAEVTVEELCEWCRGRIAQYKVPRHWRFVEAFPMTVSGKVQKYKLREEAKTLGR